MTSQVEVTRTWTRGDQFWVESANPELRWAWGREKSNRIWLAVGPHRAVRLEPDEVPRWLGLFYSLCGIPARAAPGRGPPRLRS